MSEKSEEELTMLRVGTQQGGGEVPTMRAIKSFECGEGKL